MIINYIIKALCEKESVYVNNLGLFRKEYAPAQIKDGMITPPGYRLVYDPDFDGNGFAFTMFVSQKGGMLITEATTLIDQWVAQLKTALEHNKSVSFGNFGTFAKNDKGTISFVCDRINELNLEFEGMEPVSLNSKKIAAEEEVDTEDVMVSETEETSANEAEHTENEEEISSVEEDNTSVEKNGITAEEETESDEESEAAVKTEDYDNESKENEESDESEAAVKTEDYDNTDESKENEEIDESDENEEEEETDEQKRKKHPWGLLIILLIVALLAAAAYYFRKQLTELYQQHFSSENTELVTEEALQDTTFTGEIDTLVTDGLTMDTDSLGTTENSEDTEGKAISEQNMVNQLPDGEKFFIDYEKGKFYVIVGSFRSEKEVREHIKDRKLEQYKPKVVLQQNSKNMRVCIGVFGSEIEADSYGRGTGLNYWVLK